MFAGERWGPRRCRRPSGAGFNEAPACLPGKGGGRRGGRGAPPGFNEAPACLPGKVVEDQGRHHPVRLASMRPRHVCRGKVADIAALEAVVAALQ